MKPIKGHCFFVLLPSHPQGSCPQDRNNPIVNFGRTCHEFTATSRFLGYNIEYEATPPVRGRVKISLSKKRDWGTKEEYANGFSAYSRSQSLDCPTRL